MLKGYEGNVPHMYLDSRGLVTVGAGFLIRTAQDAALFTFWKNQLGVSQAQQATSDEITKEWATIKAKPYPHLADYYRVCTTMAMSQPDIDAQLTKNIGRFEAQARQLFPEWDSFPSAAQLALLDMIYNLGSLSRLSRLSRMREEERLGQLCQSMSSFGTGRSAQRGYEESVFSGG